MHLSRLTTIGALAAALVVPAIDAVPAHALVYTATYNLGTGFGTQVLSADRGDTITILNNTPLTVAFAPTWGATPQAVTAGRTVTFTLTTVDSGAVGAGGPAVQNVLTIL